MTHVTLLPIDEKLVLWERDHLLDNQEILEVKRQFYYRHDKPRKAWNALVTLSRLSLTTYVIFGSQSRDIQWIEFEICQKLWRWTFGEGFNDRVGNPQDLSFLYDLFKHINHISLQEIAEALGWLR